jgi:hypothetical protein
MIGFSPQLLANCSLQHPTYHVGSCAAITGKIMNVHVFLSHSQVNAGKKKVTSFQPGWPFRAKTAEYHILFEKLMMIEDDI